MNSFYHPFKIILRSPPKFSQPLRNFWKKKKNFGAYNIVKPGKVSSFIPVPDNIKKPIYYSTGEPPEPIQQIEIKTDSQIRKLRKSCQIASSILHRIGKQLEVGQTTDHIDKLVHKLCIENDSYPSTLNYKGFPKSVCTSVNNVICHGIPDDRPLQNGDIINVDITVYHDGFHGDCSKTFLVGEVDEEGRKLVEATEYCLDEAIKLCKPGESINTIGYYIAFLAKQCGFTVVPCLTGHGIGEYFHGPPDIYHCDNDYPGVMKEGMTFTIEPALTQGREEIDILEDGWTVVTLNDARSAQCEHTIAITKNGAEILTLPNKEFE